MKYRILALLLILALLSGCGAPAAEPAPTAEPAPAAETAPAGEAAPAGEQAAEPDPAEEVREPGSVPPAEETREPAPEEGGEENVIRAATLGELIDAVAPGVTVELAEGVHTLTPPPGGGDVNDYCRWVDSYDGYELEIHDVADLTIRGLGADKTTISAVPRYANVLTFRRCEGVTVSDLTAGHTEEPGFCSGGVLLFDDCHGAAVERCGLYGCGTTGVQGIGCADLRVTGTSIYECSYSAVSLYECLGVTVEDCDIFRLGRGGAEWPAPTLFETYGGENLCVLGCRIRDNTAQSLLSAGRTRNVRFMSNDVRDNSFDGVVFSLERFAAAVDGCALSDNDYLFWCGGLRPVNAAGEALDDEALAAMELREIDPDEVRMPAAAPSETVAPGGEIRVSTTDELLAAIGPDRTVVLAAGVYDLSAAENWGGSGGEYYYWQESYDGPELVIEGVKGLTLRAEASRAADTVVSAVPRYANVIAFRDCDELSLIGFTAGHTEEPGFCSGGVIDLQNCRGVSLDGCRLYGCGTTGVSAWQCTALAVHNCEIFDCSWHAATVSDTDGVVFDRCDVHDVPSPALSVANCTDRLWNGEPFGDGLYDVTAAGRLAAWPLSPWDDTPAESYASTGTPFQVDSGELAFALEVKRVFAQADWEALSGMVNYPLRIYTPEGNFVFQDAQSMRPERMNQLLSGEFRRQIACEGLDEYLHTDFGSVFADGALAFECFITAEGEEFRITAVSTLFDLDR